MELLPLTLSCILVISPPKRLDSDSLWFKCRGVVGSLSASRAADSSSIAFSGLEEASKCALSNDVRGTRPYSASVLPYWIVSSPSRCVSWSADNINEGRCGVTSMNPAARVQLLAKFAILFTPPTCARESRRMAIEDLECLFSRYAILRPLERTFVFARHAVDPHGLYQRFPKAQIQQTEILPLH